MIKPIGRPLGGNPVRLDGVKAIQRLAGNLEMTLTDLAELIGQHPTTVQKWVRGAVGMSRFQEGVFVHLASLDATIVRRIFKG